MGDFDVVIVGAGIGGGALASVLARNGLAVLLLEKETEYRDKVRGEWLAPWGVVEVQRLELYDRLREAGGHHVTWHRSYEDARDAIANPLNSIDLSGLIPDVPGPLCLGHPRMCRILSETAAESGVRVLRGINRLQIGPVEGGRRTVGFEHEGVRNTVAARLVVGADGRASQVRQQAGIALHRDPTHHLFAGLLVEGADGWPAERQVIGVEGDTHFLVFPQGGGRARLYVGYALDQHKRLAGPDAAARFLQEFRLHCLPESESLVKARPAGPCRSYGNEDSWTNSPAAPNVVLIGDAAGHNDPIIGQGLSITFRDVRLVSEVLLASDDWSLEAFSGYVEERRERMQRLRFSAMMTSELENEFGPEAEQRRACAREHALEDPTLRLWAFAALIGPDVLPAEAFGPRVRERLFAAA